MKRGEWRDLPPGPELDRRVALLVGWTSENGTYPVAPVSTDFGEAFKAALAWPDVERTGVSVAVAGPDSAEQWVASVFGTTGRGSTPAVALCRAMLRRAEREGPLLPVIRNPEASAAIPDETGRMLVNQAVDAIENVFDAVDRLADHHEQNGEGSPKGPLDSATKPQPSEV